MNDANAHRVGALTLTQDEVSRRVRRAVRGFEPPPLAATRQLWRRNVKLWHQRHTHDQFVDPPPRQVEQQLMEWFDALKLKHTGKVEATEMIALLEAVGVQAVVPGEELSLHEFCRCGRAMFRDYGSDNDEGDGGITTDHASLTMIEYRRQRMLSDMRDPLKRARLCTVLAPAETKRRWSALAPPPPPSFYRATGGGATVVNGAGRRRRELHQFQYSHSAQNLGAGRAGAGAWRWGA